MLRLITSSVLLLLAIASIAQEVVIDPRVVSPKNPLDSQSTDTSKLVSTLGPVISRFESIPGCSYANPERAVLRHTVGAAPDGARVTRVLVSSEYDAGVYGPPVFESPLTSTAGIRTSGTITDSRPLWQILQTTAYVMQVTDSKGRISSSRVTVRFLDPNPTLEFHGVANAPRESRTPDGTFFEYALRISVDNLSIASIASPTVVTLRHRDGDARSVRVSGVQIWEEYSASGSRRALARPSRHFEQAKQLVLTFRSPVRNYTTYRTTNYSSWDTEVRLNIRHPAGCGEIPRQVSVRVPAARSGSEPAPPPERDTEPYFNAYRSQVVCGCNNTFETWDAVIEGCMLDQRGAPRVCAAAATQLFRPPPNDPTRRTRCEWVSPTFRRVSTEMNCNDAAPAPTRVK
jgi:hypothetical protein